MKKEMALLLFILLSVTAYSNPVDEQTARNTGYRFLVKCPAFASLPGAESLRLVHKEVNENVVTFYVFGIVNKTGFVIVAGDDKVTPVIGYSEGSNYHVNAIPDQAAAWMKNRSEAIKNAVRSAGKPVGGVRNLAAALSGPRDSYPMPASTQAVTPLTTAKWSQWAPYNDLCPSDNIRKCPTGNMATAMAQIMKFWAYPTRGRNYNSYLPIRNPGIGVLAMNFSDSQYNYSQMTPEYTQQSTAAEKNAVAKLMYDCGVAMNMEYDSQVGSGAIIEHTGPSATYALRTFFGYDPGLIYKEKKNYSDAQWLVLMKTELDAGRPILYVGGVNVWVCDGYDNRDYFHMNWGWEGALNGYFSLSDLKLDFGANKTADFTANQSAVIGIKPPGSGGTHNMILQAAMTANPSAFDAGGSITVTAVVKNSGTASFTGDLVARVHVPGDAQYIYYLFSNPLENQTLAAGESKTLTFSVANHPKMQRGGEYTLKIYHWADNSSFMLFPVESATVKNDLKITVRALSADGYEPNNTAGEAHLLALPAFTQNAAVIHISPANCHQINEVDFYKINLAAGYSSYTVSGVLYDANNQFNNSSHTLNAKISYSTNGSTWSTPEDRQFSNPSAQDGTLYLKIEPFTQGHVGTYAAKIDLTANCTFNLSSSSRQATLEAGTGVVTVTTSSLCTWTATSNDTWIRITSAANTTGSSSVVYSYDRNTTPFSRTGTITIANRSYSVYQVVPCAFTITGSPSAEVTAAPGTGSVAVAANRSNCQWRATSNTTWIRITSGQSTTGSGSLVYSYDENTTSFPRTGTITLAGRTYSVTQVAPCTFLTGSPSARVTAAPGTGSVAVAASRSNCPWTATSHVTWISITAGQSTTGSGSLEYSYEENTTPSARTGTLTVAGYTYTVTQASPCIFTLAGLTFNNVTSAGGTGTIGVTADRHDCTWGGISNAGWIRITSGQSTTGSGSLGYSYDENTDPFPRTGSIIVAERMYTVTQEAGCLFTLRVPSAQATDEQGRGTIAVTANNSKCPWTTTSNDAWIRITSAPNKTGSGSVTYSYEENMAASPRTGTITAAGRTYTVTQAGASTCSFTLTEGSTSAIVTSATGAGNVAVAASRSNCPWEATSQATWIRISIQSKAGSGNVAYSYEQNTDTSPRTGTITVAGRTYTITQAAACLFTLTDPVSARVTAAQGTGTITVAAYHNNCLWTATSNDTWMGITSGQSTTGPGSVTYSYEGNTTSSPRTGTILVAGHTYTLIQEAASACSFTLTAGSVSTRVSAAAGTGNVAVGAGSNNCRWTANANASWIKITSGLSSTGSGSVAYSYEENRESAERTGTITLAGYTYTLIQTAVVTGFETTGGLRIFPNPAGDFVTIDLSAGDIKCVSLKIANQVGQIFYETEYPNQTLQIPLKGFSSGLYFIFIREEERLVVQKLVVK